MLPLPIRQTNRLFSTPFIASLIFLMRHWCQKIRPTRFMTGDKNQPCRLHVRTTQPVQEEATAIFLQNKLFGSCFSLINPILFGLEWRVHNEKENPYRNNNPLLFPKSILGQ
jgi:hypothetical protein